MALGGNLPLTTVVTCSEGPGVGLGVSRDRGAGLVRRLVSRVRKLSFLEVKGKLVSSCEVRLFTLSQCLTCCYPETLQWKLAIFGHG